MGFTLVAINVPIKLIKFFIASEKRMLTPPLPGQKGRHIADDIFKRIFVNGNIRITIQFLPKCVPKGPIDKRSALVQVLACHSFESPSIVDPQWKILYWGSQWNLHTVCWDAVGCEWGTTSVYFGITYVCFIPSRLPVFAVEPQYRHQDVLFLSKVSFEGRIKIVTKFHVGLNSNGVSRTNIE